MALVVEMVVDRGMDGGEFLQGLDVSEPSHCPFPPSKGGSSQGSVQLWPVPWLISQALSSTYQGFPFCLPRMAPLYTRGPPSARNSVHRTIVQLQRPSPQPALTCDRLEPLLSGHSSDTAPHLCPFFVRRASLHSPRVSLPGPVAPRSSAACRRTAAGSDALPPAGASSTSRASPAGLRFSPAAAASSSATSA